MVIQVKLTVGHPLFPFSSPRLFNQVCSLVFPVYNHQFLGSLVREEFSEHKPYCPFQGWCYGGRTTRGKEEWKLYFWSQVVGDSNPVRKPHPSTRGRRLSSGVNDYTKPQESGWVQKSTGDTSGGRRCWKARWPKRKFYCKKMPRETFLSSERPRKEDWFWILQAVPDSQRSRWLRNRPKERKMKAVSGRRRSHPSDDNQKVSGEAAGRLGLPRWVEPRTTGTCCVSQKGQKARKQATGQRLRHQKSLWPWPQVHLLGP